MEIKFIFINWVGGQFWIIFLSNGYANYREFYVFQVGICVCHIFYVCLVDEWIIMAFIVIYWVVGLFSVTFLSNGWVYHREFDIFQGCESVYHTFYICLVDKWIVVKYIFIKHYIFIKWGFYILNFSGVWMGMSYILYLSSGWVVRHQLNVCRASSMEADCCV